MDKRSADRATLLFSKGEQVFGTPGLCLVSDLYSLRSVDIDEVRRRDAFRDMLDSVKTPFNECIRVLQENMKLDPYFVEFYNWAKENNVPIVVLSSGMKPIISALFETLLGHKPDPSNLAIVSNDVESRDGKDINTEGGWQIKYHDDR